jgi:hypothetical protein
MVGAGRFGLPTSASRTLRANQTALRPEIVAILSLSASRTLRANQTALRLDKCFLEKHRNQRRRLGSQWVFRSKKARLSEQIGRPFGAK